jgi:hypothetical protein
LIWKSNWPNPSSIKSSCGCQLSKLVSWFTVQSSMSLITARLLGFVGSRWLMHAFVYVQPMECHALLLMPFLLLGMFAKLASVLYGHDKIHTSHNAESQYHFCFCIALLCNCVHIQLWAGLGLEHVEYFCVKLGLAIAFKSCSSIFLGMSSKTSSLGFNEWICFCKCLSLDRLLNFSYVLGDDVIWQWWCLICSKRW